MTENDRIVARIDRWLRAGGSQTRYGEDDASVLRYVRSQLTPEGYAARSDDDKNVLHLIEVAKVRLAPYDKEDRSHDHPPGT